MNNFDLKKFLVENKLTTASKITNEAMSDYNTQPASRLEDSNALSVQAALSKAGITSDQQLELYSAEGQVWPFEEDKAYSYQEVVKVLSDIIRDNEKEATEAGLESPEMLPQWDFEVGQMYDKKGPIALALPEVDDIVVIPVGSGMNENEETPVTEQPTQNEVSKYLKHESAQAILSELENEIALAGLDLRKEQIQKIVQEIESKISTLEEDAGMQGFVDKAAINEKRRVVKELNKAYEKVNKLSEKMHAKRKKKMK